MPGQSGPPGKSILLQAANDAMLLRALQAALLEPTNRCVLSGWEIEQKMRAVRDLDAPLIVAEDAVIAHPSECTDGLKAKSRLLLVLAADESRSALNRRHQLSMSLANDILRLLPDRQTDAAS